MSSSLFKIPGSQLIIFIVGNLLLVFSCSQTETDTLTANSPIYTTYAAAKERSEFSLDEGYEFHFYDDQEGIDFTTDTGGDLCIGFKINGNWIYNLEDMFAKPEILVSYADMIEYRYYPVAGLRVDILFLVKSSHTAIMDISIQNERKEVISGEVVLLIRNDFRAFDNAYLLNDSTFSFTHQEYPDSWTIGHNLPFVDSISNVFSISKMPDKKGIFNSIKGESAQVPFYVFPSTPVQFQLSGRSFVNNSRNLSSTKETRIQVVKNNDPAAILTENSPVWKNMQGTINQDGYFRMEFGNFGQVETNDVYSVSIDYLPDNLHANQQVHIADHQGNQTRKDFHLTEQPDTPGIIHLNITGDQRLEWEPLSGGAYEYFVYRRAYPFQGVGVYKKICTTANNWFVDEQGNDSTIYGYVVSARQNSVEIGMHSNEVTNIHRSVFSRYIDANESSIQPVEFAKILSFSNSFNINPGDEFNLRSVRVVGRKSDPENKLINEAVRGMKEQLGIYKRANENVFKDLLIPEFHDPDLKLLYISGFNMMKQVFYPPEGKSDFNYYVFSREPTWGWGHGGQVFHESLAMAAYALLDPEGAMNSQRVYAQRQYENGYINYRTGSYLDEIIEFNDQLTSSAPWYNYQNWEIYRITNDKDFLAEMYASGKKFYNFYITNRDQDGDGLCEWGGHAILESVRDASVAVWDEVAWPAEFEGLDVNCMLVMEAKSLENMAMELGMKEDAGKWKQDWEKRSALINNTFWDENTGFYYHADRKDNDFTYKSENDLIRQEIIGFLPMWAGISSDRQAEKLVEVLTEQSKFWRKYGIPSLAADDPFYNSKGYWNGPVWVEWNYLIVNGLLDYGYKEEARELTKRVAEGMIIQLKKNHNLWEFYSPDEPWAGYHKTYIWAGIINRMLWDVYQ